MNKRFQSLLFKYAFSALVGSMLFLASCSPDDVPELPNEKKCFKKETTISIDGVPVASIAYFYNADDLLELELAYDLQMNLTDSTHYTYNSDEKLTRRYSYNFPFAYWQEQTYSYNAKGNEIMNELQVNGSMYNRFQLFRGEDEFVDSVHVTAQGVLTRHLYTSDKDTVRAITEYDIMGNLRGKRIYTYSANKTVLTSYDAQSNVIAKTEITYDEQGREIMLKMFDGQDLLSITNQTEYDSNGNIIKVTTDYVGQGVYVYDTSWECME